MHKSEHSVTQHCRHSNIPHEATWKAFLEGAGTAATAAGLPPLHGRLQWEWLFSLYVHCRPGFFFPPGSLFAGRETPEQLHARWAQHTLVRMTLVVIRSCALLLMVLLSRVVT